MLWIIFPMPIRTLKSDILRESYGCFTKTFFLPFSVWFFIFYFFSDENSDGIKFDDHHELKPKKSFISSKHGQTRAYYISKFMEMSTRIQWWALFLPRRSFLHATPQNPHFKWNIQKNIFVQQFHISCPFFYPLMHSHGFNLGLQ